MRLLTLKNPHRNQNILSSIKLIFKYQGNFPFLILKQYKYLLTNSSSKPIAEGLPINKITTHLILNRSSVRVVNRQKPISCPTILKKETNFYQVRSQVLQTFNSQHENNYICLNSQFDKLLNESAKFLPILNVGICGNDICHGLPFG